MEPTTWQQWHEQCVTEANNRVFAVEHAGRRLWIKRAEDKTRRWHLWQDRVSRLPGLGVLRRTGESDGRAALRQEAQTLRRLHAAGVRVPEVVAEGEDWIALSDLGRPLRDQLHAATTPAEATRLALAGVEVLARLHAAGLSHGNAQARNFAGSPDVLGLIDFEEDVQGRLTLTAAQTRDWIFYLMSLERADTRHGVVLDAAVGCAQAVMPAPVRRRLRWLRRVVWPLAALLNPLRHWLGRDGREAVAFGLALRELQNQTEHRRKRLLQIGGTLLATFWAWSQVIDAD